MYISGSLIWSRTCEWLPCLVPVLWFRIRCQPTCMLPTRPAVPLFFRLLAPLCLLGRNAAMAWMSSGSSNDDLISRLKKNGILQTPRVEAAMKAVDRKHYSPYNPFQDSPQSICYGATISAPHTDAHESLHRDCTIFQLVMLLKVLSAPLWSHRNNQSSTWLQLLVQSRW